MESSQLRGIMYVDARVGDAYEAGTDCSVALQLMNKKRGPWTDPGARCETAILDTPGVNDWRRRIPGRYTWENFVMKWNECNDFIPSLDQQVLQFKFKLWPSCIDHLLITDLHVIFNLGGKKMVKYYWKGYSWFRPGVGWTDFDEALAYHAETGLPW